jgi:internalin A
MLRAAVVGEAVGTGGEQVRVLAEGELDEVLARAREERWTALAVVWEGDRDFGSVLVHEGWPPNRVFIAREWMGDDGARALASLTSLTSLYLFGNGIGDDGAQALASLIRLTSLTVPRNQITQLRPLISLPRLEQLYVHGNPVAEIHRELLGDQFTNCLPALTAYYHDLDKGGAPNDVVKILLVGNGCVGKTTLAYCLAHGHAPPAPIEERTHGIVLQRIPLELPGGTRVDARLWDFGGQELYHATHRLFFHGNAIYLLLWAEETDEVPEETRTP